MAFKNHLPHFPQTCSLSHGANFFPVFIIFLSVLFIVSFVWRRDCITQPVLSIPSWPLRRARSLVSHPERPALSQFIIYSLCFLYVPLAYLELILMYNVRKRIKFKHFHSYPVVPKQLLNMWILVNKEMVQESVLILYKVHFQEIYLIMLYSLIFYLLSYFTVVGTIDSVK